jgi:hypothetical protein
MFGTLCGTGSLAGVTQGSRRRPQQNLEADREAVDWTMPAGTKALQSVGPIASQVISRAAHVALIPPQRRGPDSPGLRITGRIENPPKVMNLERRYM